MLIVAGCRIVAARRVFEFGTFLGNNTFNIALNTPLDAEILTLDLDDRERSWCGAAPGGRALTQMHLASIDPSLDFAGSPCCRKIKATWSGILRPSISSSQDLYRSGRFCVH